MKIGNAKMTFPQVNDGGQKGSRTPDTRIFSPLLYQLSYLATSVANDSSITITNIHVSSRENF